MENAAICVRQIDKVIAVASVDFYICSCNTINDIIAGSTGNGSAASLYVDAIMPAAARDDVSAAVAYSFTSRNNINYIIATPPDR